MLQELPKTLGSTQTALWEFAPLPIAALEDVKADKTTSYKDAWDKTKCTMAMNSTGMYEAGANVLWIDPAITCVEVPHSEPTVHTILRCVSASFSAECLWKASASTRSGQKVKVDRLVWPVAMEAYTLNKALILNQDHYRSSIKLVGGHSIVYAWYVAMFLATRDSNPAFAAHLWQCGLTVSLQALA